MGEIFRHFFLISAICNLHCELQKCRVKVSYQNNVLLPQYVICIADCGITEVWLAILLYFWVFYFRSLHCGLQNCGTNKLNFYCENIFDILNPHCRLRVVERWKWKTKRITTSAICIVDFGLQKKKIKNPPKPLNPQQYYIKQKNLKTFFPLAQYHITSMTSISHHIHMFLFLCSPSLPLPNSPSYPYLPLHFFFPSSTSDSSMSLSSPTTPHASSTLQFPTIFSSLLASLLFLFFFLASLAMTSITHHLHMFLFLCSSSLPLPNSPSYPYLPLQCFFSPSFDPPLVYPSISSTKINIY